MKNKDWLIYGLLLLIILLAAFLYFYMINQLPIGLSDDEAAVGYNAYSILLTGRDEFGKFFPIAFRFFGAYTPPLYVYLTVPAIKIFGISAAAIRIPSGMVSLLGIVIVYLFVEKLGLFRSRLVGLAGAFTFAIIPWVFYYARVGYEVTTGYIIFSLGMFFLWDGLSQKKVSLVGLFVLSISSYIAHTERYLVPIFLFSIVVFFRKQIFVKRNTKKIIIGSIVLFVTQIPNLFLLTTRSFWVKNSLMNPNTGEMIKDFVSQWLTYFSPKELFGISSDINLQHTSPELPLIYSWLIIPFLIGLYRLYLKKGTPAGKFLIVWLLVSPIPGALSGHFISIQRVMPLIVPIILVISLGFEFIKSRVGRRFFVSGFILLSAFSLLLLWRSYFVLFPKERWPYWSYGYEQLAGIIKDRPSDRFVIDSARARTVYVNLLFYLKYPPDIYQELMLSELLANYYSVPNIDLSHRFANLELRPVTWARDVFVDQILVGDALAISSQQVDEHFLVKVFEINDPNGIPILFGYKTNPLKKKADNRTKESLKVRGIGPRKD
ncbi:hypothetical protein HYU91_01920 [Candidatus Collierbacteria bacterium]|nr:hypothetical protein [Candidatus Collierbacteria bacterium]